MTRDDLDTLKTKLRILHDNTRNGLDRQLLRDTVDQLELAYWRELNAETIAKDLLNARTASKAQFARITELEQLLSGKPATESTIPAQGQGRGIDEAEAREG